MKRFLVCWILFGLLVAFLCGCEKPEDLGSFDWPWDHHSSSGDAAAAETPAQTAQGANPTANAAAAKLVFRFGGFNGGNAAETPAAQIGSLHMSRSGMSYKWLKGGCEQLGAKSRTDCDNTLACAFFWSDKENAWIGGKFDWVSTSRTTRDFKNLNSGYGGWTPEEFFWAPRRAFCIVSKDGKKRTNLLVTEEP